MQKILSFKKLTKLLDINTASLIGGSFDPFGTYYLKLLKWASVQSRPLVVIVHPDKIVGIKRGFMMPLYNQNKRAKLIASLD